MNIIRSNSVIEHFFDQLSTPQLLSKEDKDFYIMQVESLGSMSYTSGQQPLSRSPVPVRVRFVTGPYAFSE